MSSRRVLGTAVSLLMISCVVGHSHLRASAKTWMDMVEEIPSSGCSMPAHELTMCQSSGGCCMESDCLFGGCDEENPPTPAPVSKEKNGAVKNGDVLGGIVGEDVNFGDTDKHPIVRSHMDGEANFARLWSSRKSTTKEGLQDDNLNIPSDPNVNNGGDGGGPEFSANVLMQGVKQTLNRRQLIPTRSPTKDYWLQSVHQDASHVQQRNDVSLPQGQTTIGFDMAAYEKAKAKRQQLGAVDVRASSKLQDATLIAEKEHVRDAISILDGKTATDQQHQQAMHKDKYGNMVLGGNR